MKNWTLKGLTAGKATTKWPRSGSDDGQTGVLGMPIFDSDECSPSCMECVKVCPTEAFKAVNGPDEEQSMSLDYGRCINCQVCIEVCPTDALQPSSNFEFGSKSRSDLVLGKTGAGYEADELKSRINSRFRGSLHIRHVDAGSCNGCESELGALVNPFYNLHRLGIFFTPSPRFADLLLVTGPVVPQMRDPLLRTWEAMPNPRFVMAAGTCAVSGAPFDFGYASGSGLDGVLPVDIFVPGCPPTPAAFMHALLLLTDRLPQKVRGGRYEY